MKNLSLGICIPTYNRQDYLCELLNSLAANICSYHNVRLFISDNASSDSTEKVVDSFANNLDIVYHKNRINLGPDCNYLQVMKMANTDYVWLMGSDDLVVDGALSLIFSKLSAGQPDIMIGSRIEFSDSGRSDFSLRRWSDIPGDMILLSNDLASMNGYFSELSSVGGLFSYLSSIVYKRACIDLDDPLISTFIGTAYSHAYVMLKALSCSPLRFLVTDQPFAKCRLDNDGFWRN